MNNYTELIDQYLSGNLDAQERLAFEQDLKTNEFLRREFEVQKHIMEGLKRAGLKLEFSHAVRKHVLRKKIIKGAVIAAVVATAIIAISIAAGKMPGISSILGSASSTVEVPKELPSQKFEINNMTDTIIETSGGLVFAIPAGAFSTDPGQVEFRVSEALSPQDIMKAGLSTTSNGELLETAGMFHVKAVMDGRELQPLKPIKGQVPTNSVQPGMMLFDGEKGKDGLINWVNPIPIARDLKTYNMKDLDFYPVDYLPTLESLGLPAGNRKYTDSLYYSFGGYVSYTYTQEMQLGINDRWISEAKASLIQSVIKDSVAPYQIDPNTVRSIKDSRFNHTLLATREFQERIKYIHQICPPENDMDLMPDKQLSSQGIAGKKIIKMNCVSCHAMQIKVLGPALAGVQKRHSDEWLMQWIRNNEKLRAEGDKEAIAVFNANGGAQMNVFENLSPSDIRSVITFIREYKVSTTIHDKYFYLDLYVRNIHRPLYWIDSVCAANAQGAEKAKFLEFYKRRDGYVSVAIGLQQKLNTYFDHKYAAYSEASEKTWRKHENKLRELKAISDEKRREQSMRDFTREDKVFTEEYCRNVIDAYRQLGEKKECPLKTPPPAREYYAIEINTTGWKNLDQYVMDATVGRESLDYVSETGKKAVITYSGIQAKVNHMKDYDRVLAYLIPDSLSSFQRMKQESDGFSEKLNGLLHYDLFILAFKGEQAYYGIKPSVSPSIHHFDLEAVSAKDLDMRLKSYSRNKRKDLVRDIAYQSFENKESKRLEQVRKEQEFRETIARSIFPCDMRISVVPANPDPTKTP